MLDISGDLRISRINGSLSRGGWECRLTSLSPRETPDDPVDATYGATASTDALLRWQKICVRWKSAFGTCPATRRVAFVGWTMPSRFQFDRASSRSEFIAQTTDGALRRGWIQGISFEDVGAGARADYHEYDNAHFNMRLGRLVQHILGYHDAGADLGPQWVAHTNLVYHAVENPHGWIHLDNVDLTNSVRVDRYNVRETDNLWARLREMARNEFYEIVFDKTDTLWYKPHPMYLAPLPDPVMVFDEDFCVVPPNVEVRDVDQVRQVKLHAMTDAGGTLHSDYPALVVPSYGNVVDISRLRCNDQATLDLWAERRWAYLNRQFTVRWTAPGLCGLLFEILDRVSITYTGVTTVNGVHLDWLEKKFWIQEIDVTPDDRFGGTSTFLLEEENIP